MSELQQGEGGKLNFCPSATGYPVNDDTRRVSGRAALLT